jgi:uncharacterized protein YwgA
MLWREENRLSKLLDYRIKNFEGYMKADMYLDSSDFVLMLLSVSPVDGNTKLQKEVFLIWKEIFHDVSYEQPFYPYRYGAYSNVLNDIIRILEGQQLIKIKRSGKRVVYEITNKGKIKMLDRLKSLNLDLRNLEDKVKDWKNWDSKGIKRYVYRNYPEYTEETMVPYLKWE